MFNWKLILVAIEALGVAGTAPLPIEPNVTVPFEIQVVVRPGTSEEPFATATRLMDDMSDETKKCVVTVVSNSEGWNISPNRMQSASAVSLHPIQVGAGRVTNPRMFIVAHEVGHCFDWVKPPAGTSAVGYKIWKESFADAYAIMVLKRSEGLPAFRLKKLGDIRSYGYDEPYREFWDAAIKAASDVDVIGKSDKDLLAIASEIRRNIWKSS